MQRRKKKKQNNLKIEIEVKVTESDHPAHCQLFLNFIYIFITTDIVE